MNELLRLMAIKRATRILLLLTVGFWERVVVLFQRPKFVIIHFILFIKFLLSKIEKEMLDSIESNAVDFWINESKKTKTYWSNIKIVLHVGCCITFSKLNKFSRYRNGFERNAKRQKEAKKQK